MRPRKTELDPKRKTPVLLISLKTLIKLFLIEQHVNAVGIFHI
jgi:hypothetical protein